jgi:hypothetical protein
MRKVPFISNTSLDGSSDTAVNSGQTMSKSRPSPESVSITQLLMSAISPSRSCSTDWEGAITRPERMFKGQADVGVGDVSNDSAAEQPVASSDSPANAMALFRHRRERPAHFSARPHLQAEAVHGVRNPFVGANKTRGKTFHSGRTGPSVHYIMSSISHPVPVCSELRGPLFVS